MPQLLESIRDQLGPNALIDIGIVALLIYWLFSLIRGTRAVSLVIGVTVLFAVYAAARAFDFRLLTQIMETGAVVGLFALVVVFQPELRRALERIGRVGSFGWLFSPAAERTTEHIATEVARAAAGLSADRHGALIVLERETGLEDTAESGVMLHADLSADLLRTIFTPRSPLHDGAVIVRAETVVAAGALLPLAETTMHTERFGTRHRAALGITESTDAVVVVVSEENAQISLVERARIVRNLNEAQLARALRTLLTPQSGRTLLSRRTGGVRTGGQGRSPRLGELSRLVGRDRQRAGAGATPTGDAQPTAMAATATTTPRAGTSGPASAATTRPAPVETRVADTDEFDETIRVPASGSDTDAADGGRGDADGRAAAVPDERVRVDADAPASASSAARPEREADAAATRPAAGAKR